MPKRTIYRVIWLQFFFKREGLTNKTLCCIIKVLNEVYEKHLLRRGLLKEDKMIKVNSIKFNNNTKKNISFRENHVNNMTPNEAILSLQGPNAMVEFQKNLNLSQKADAVQNPLTALLYKVIKTFKLFVKPASTLESNVGEQKLSLVA